MKHNFKIGDYIIITKRPSIWSSTLNGNCPVNKRIKYPYYCQIENLKFVEHNNHWAMTEGIYG
jgi:hypothetical protein